MTWEICPVDNNPVNNAKGSRSAEDVIRGSVNIPLSSFGREQARMRAIQFRRKGGVDNITSSSLSRAIDTAEAVHRANPAMGNYEAGAIA